MAKIDIITLSGLTATDGSIIASGATVKFGSEFMAATTDIIIRPVVYRNRELFDAGYLNVPVPEETIPYDFILQIPEEEYYVLTPTILYGHVCDYLNTLFDTDMFEVKIITD